MLTYNQQPNQHWLLKTLEVESSLHVLAAGQLVVTIIVDASGSAFINVCLKDCLSSAVLLLHCFLYEGLV